MAINWNEIISPYLTIIFSGSLHICVCVCVGMWLCVCVCPHGLDHDSLLSPAFSLCLLKVPGILDEQIALQGLKSHWPCSNTTVTSGLLQNVTVIYIMMILHDKFQTSVLIFFYVLFLSLKRQHNVLKTCCCAYSFILKRPPKL